VLKKIYIKNLSSENQYNYQEVQNLMLILNLLKKMQKTYAKKVINKIVTENVDFYYTVQKFSDFNFFG
jgi:hypothetical protein